MRIDAAGLGGELMCHDAGLSKAATAVGGVIAGKVLLENLPCCVVTGHGFRGLLCCGHTFGIVAQVFRQIAHARLQPVVQRVGFRIGRVAQRPDFEAQTGFFKGDKFLCDEGLRQARPTFYTNGESERMGS